MRCERSKDGVRKLSRYENGAYIQRVYPQRSGRRLRGRTDVHKLITMSTAQDLGATVSDLRIGPLAFRGAVLLAPMAGVTDAGMRAAAQRRGASLAYSEMVAS